MHRAVAATAPLAGARKVRNQGEAPNLSGFLSIREFGRVPFALTLRAVSIA